MNKNAIEERVDRLHDQWAAFAGQPEARLLRWLLGPDERPMLDAFLQVEEDERTGSSPDLFLELSEPFADAASYGAALLAALVQRFDEARTELEEEGFDAWQPPQPAGGTPSLVALVDACVALQRHHAELIERLVLVLTPSAIADEAEWQQWLRAAVQRLPATVRLLVADAADAPRLEWLAQAEPQRVVSRRAELGMDEALDALVQEGGTGAPDAQFRIHFTRLATSLGKGRLREAEQAAQTALAIAREHGWAHLGIAVHCAMGAGLIGARRIDDALVRFREADRIGAEMAAADEPVEADLGAKLRLQAALGAGSALVSDGRFAEAAGAYLDAVPLADAAADALMGMECWRMAAYCREQTGDAEAAWTLGLHALDAAERIEPEQRAHSTLPFVEQALKRLARGSAAHVEWVERRVAALLDAAAAPPDAALPAPAPVQEAAV